MVSPIGDCFLINVQQPGDFGWFHLRKILYSWKNLLFFSAYPVKYSLPEFHRQEEVYFQKQGTPSFESVKNVNLYILNIYKLTNCANFSTVKLFEEVSE